MNEQANHPSPHPPTRKRRPHPAQRARRISGMASVVGMLTITGYLASHANASEATASADGSASDLGYDTATLRLDEVGGSTATFVPVADEDAWERGEHNDRHENDEWDDEWNDEWDDDAVVLATPATSAPATSAPATSGVASTTSTSVAKSTTSTTPAAPARPSNRPVSRSHGS